MELVLIEEGAQWLSGKVLDSPRTRGRGFELHQRHCNVSLSKNINPSLVLVQPRKTRPFITVRSLMGRKESNNQTNKQKKTNRRLVLFCSQKVIEYLTADANEYVCVPNIRKKTKQDFPE